MSLNKVLYDGKPQAHPAIGFVGCTLVEYRGEQLRGDSSTVIADTALDCSVHSQCARANHDVPAWSGLDCVGNQVLKDSPEQTGVRIGGEIVGHIVAELSAGGARDWMQ